MDKISIDHQLKTVCTVLNHEVLEVLEVLVLSHKPTI